MRRTVSRLLKISVSIVVLLAVAALGFRAWDSQRGPGLSVWHTYVPREMTAKEIDAADWNGYLAAENRLFDDVRTHVVEKIAPAERIASNRYYEGSPIYPEHFAQDWNRSYILEPQREPAGAVVLLHGLTDSPYSLRHIARNYRDRGFVAIGIRLPGHGTVPAALTSVEWRDWTAATRLAVREARRRIGPDKPLELVGFSNGGALALQYALDAIEDDTLTRPTRVILISPMIGVTRFARFAGFAGLPSVLPAFAKAAWLGIVPEFNPFKYNSFPVNGARQAYLLTDALREQIGRLARDNRLAALPPLLTFQSVIDFTVSSPAVMSTLYDRLPENGSEIVLFDINRDVRFRTFLRAASYGALGRLLRRGPQNYRTTVIENASPDTDATVARTIDAGTTTEHVEPLHLDYPPDIFSLSHVAIPFPVTDPLYGTHPGTDENFNANLGTLSVRGERGTLIFTLDSMFRIASNPFFPYVVQRIDDGIGKKPGPVVNAPERSHEPLLATPETEAEAADDALAEPEFGDAWAP
ncbi:alpha/beta hydrolase [Paraburkholderia caballeronis]|uniref:Lysophospholipase, alpha-beta hydrolase superfamily n=1 Tax=Paraburkholderia caballeronis TaxID=416943 RepID=A0A1H7KSJ6_9BURK|nr:alpha/beta hydrolase [Paraburkholderia caballeronis]PXW28145.1 alpha-beta hydrolase superfamily lysophospholipase [Paraburkholderia caballeronis]PXX03511.1 alpha-beta hydrolase superfamily lysophospholipase [Paraburkholderia caballeronis]RAK04255.1 alpha-beta hydrolase superfamily lysophospholipase [Paraburkholderia caballeronis]SED87533.1 Lysophospholipase, alpha-beta hydrolase superfamily [Paraburkholderia caballeronis]SEK89728.1 Lysophospholipase, alpha-beta hydrolase superfamily [Parabu